MFNGVLYEMNLLFFTSMTGVWIDDRFRFFLFAVVCRECNFSTTVQYRSIVPIGVYKNCTMVLSS